MSWTNLCGYSFQITDGAGQWIIDSSQPSPVAPPLPSATQRPVTIGNGTKYDYVSFDKLYLSLIDSAGGVYAKVLLSIHTDGTDYGLWPQPSFLHPDGSFYDYSNDFDFVVNCSCGKTDCKNKQNRLPCVVTCPKREIAHIPQTWAYSGSADGYSTWGLDYGANNWELDGDAAVQTGFVDGSGSRAWPVALCESNGPNNDLILGECPAPGVSKSLAHASGTAYSGAWQVDMKIGSTAETSAYFVETFYLAERRVLKAGPDYYLDGAPHDEDS
eukprot:scaffold3398_cov118-Isochrysis_galbana.AAC.1